MALSCFAEYSWFILFYNFLVIPWGAYVRATCSGSGCGSHWSFCRGEVLPRVSQIETIIEFSHRLSSGLALAFMLILVVWA